MLLLAPLSAVHAQVHAQGTRQAAALEGIIGHWTATADSAWTVDGSAWRGQSAPADLRRASERLFGSASDAFVRNSSAAGAFPLAVAASVRDFTSGTLRVQFKMVGGASDQNAGIVFNLSPSGEYLYARYNTKDGDLALWRFANGERQLIVHGTGTSTLALGQWHELVVTVRGRNLVASITGNSAVALAHTLDVAPTGRVGVWVKRDAITAFRGFSQTP